MKVFASLFSKSDRHPTRVALVASAEAKYPCLKKRHGGVRGTTQVGGSPSYAILLFGFYPLFSLWQKAQRKKLGKKEHAEKGISPSAEGDRRSRRLRQAFKKA